MRRKALKADGSGLLLSPEDFILGQPTIIYGNSIMIDSCDDYTHEFYTNIGRSQSNNT